MTRTHDEVRDLPESKWTAATAPRALRSALEVIEGRWKLEILFCLFGGKVQRFSDLERALPGVSQKMLAQQLRQLEENGVVARTAYAETPPRVEYRLTEWGQTLCPRLNSLLLWIEARPA